MSVFQKHRALVLLAVSAVLVFCACAIIRTLPFSPLDNAWMQMSLRFDYASVTDLMLALSSVLGPTVLAVLSVLLCVGLAYERKIKWALFFLLSMLLTGVSVLIFKQFFAVLRPVSTFISEIGYSFPSAHAAVASTFFFSLLYAVEENAHDVAVMVLASISAASLVLAVGFSRTYLEVHMITDVIAGFALGAFWVSAGIYALKRHRKMKVSVWYNSAVRR